MCRALQVSLSGYYRWRDRPESCRQGRPEFIEGQLADTRATFKVRYGAPRIAEELQAMNTPCSVNYVAQLLKQQGFSARNGKSFNYGGYPLTMNSQT